MRHCSSDGRRLCKGPSLRCVCWPAQAEPGPAPGLTLARPALAGPATHASAVRAPEAQRVQCRCTSPFHVKTACKPGYNAQFSACSDKVLCGGAGGRRAFERGHGHHDDGHRRLDQRVRTPCRAPPSSLQCILRLRLLSLRQCKPGTGAWSGSQSCAGAPLSSSPRLIPYTGRRKSTARMHPPGVGSGLC